MNDPRVAKDLDVTEPDFTLPGVMDVPLTATHLPPAYCAATMALSGVEPVTESRRINITAASLPETFVMFQYLLVATPSNGGVRLETSEYAARTSSACKRKLHYLRELSGQCLYEKWHC